MAPVLPTPTFASRVHCNTENQADDANSSTQQSRQQSNSVPPNGTKGHDWTLTNDRFVQDSSNQDTLNNNSSSFLFTCVNSSNNGSGLALKARKSALVTSSLRKSSTKQPAAPHKLNNSNIDIDLHASYSESLFDTNYEIIECVGRGSFGDVFKVYCSSTQNFYAIKQIIKRYKSLADHERKLNEALTHSALPKHPNIVNFYSYWEENNCLFIKLELCEYNLFSYIQNSIPIPLYKLSNILFQILHGLRVLHNLQIVHMDLKPENIFVDSQGICKIGDFGLSVNLNQIKKENLQEGDSKYLAIEVLKHGKVSLKADIFSLAMSMLELINGLELPRNGNMWQSLRHEDTDNIYFQNIPKNLLPVIKSMVRFKCEERPTCDEILDSIDALDFRVIRFFDNMMSRLTFFCKTGLHTCRRLFSSLTIPFRSFISSQNNTPLRRNTSMLGSSLNNSSLVLSYDIATYQVMPYEPKNIMPQNLSKYFSSSTTSKKENMLNDLKENNDESLHSDLSQNGNSKNAESEHSRMFDDCRMNLHDSFEDI